MGCGVEFMPGIEANHRGCTFSKCVVMYAEPFVCPWCDGPPPGYISVDERFEECEPWDCAEDWRKTYGMSCVE